MIGKDLNKVLNYMKQYVENKYEHDSEPMLNWKDLKLILDEIERLNNIINEIVNIYEGKDTTEDIYFALEELFEKESIFRKIKKGDR